MLNRSQILKTLGLAKTFLYKDDFIPILTSFCMKKDSIYAFNDNQGIKIKYGEKIGVEGAVPGELLINMLKSFKTDKVDFTKSKDKLVITTKNSDVNLPLHPAKDYFWQPPELSDFDIKVTLKRPFFDGLENVLLSVGDAPSNPAFNGVTLNVDDNTLTLYSTDGKTLSRYETDCLVESGVLDTSIILPKMFCNSVLNVYDSLDQDLETVTLYIKDDSCLIILDNYEIFTMFIQAEPPPYESKYNLMKEEFGDDEGVPVESELVNALERAALISKASGVTTLDWSVFQIEDDILSIITERDVGKTIDRIKLEEGKVEEMAFKMNPQLFRRALVLPTFVRWHLYSDIGRVCTADGFEHFISFSE